MFSTLVYVRQHMLNSELQQTKVPQSYHKARAVIAQSV
jgi:hypothetical protein